MTFGNTLRYKTKVKSVRFVYNTFPGLRDCIKKRLYRRIIHQKAVPTTYLFLGRILNSQQEYAKAKKVLVRGKKFCLTIDPNMMTYSSEGTTHPLLIDFDYNIARALVGLGGSENRYQARIGFLNKIISADNKHEKARRLEDKIVGCEETELFYKQSK